MDSYERIQEIAYDLNGENLSLSMASMSMKGQGRKEPVQEFKISYPFEPSLSKERCALCRLHFNRDTVNYKVPIHRIMELKKEWDKKGENSFEGRRYNFPSYLYTTTSVCLFCSQFFSTMPNERQPSPPKANLNVLQLKEPGPKLSLKTGIARTDVAQGQKAYQSSEVDYKFAYYANLAPYDNFTRTKREVDPWWEMDMGQKYNLDFITFDILIGIRQKIEVNVFLMDRPYGFEDPFLDNMCSKGFPVYRVTFTGKDKPTHEVVKWQVPPNNACSAIRIQLRGIQVLSLQKFQAFQGNDVYVPKEDESLSSAIDLASSYASLRPETVSETMKEKQMIEMKSMIQSGEYAELVNNSADSLSHNHQFDTVDAVGNLKDLIRNRYSKIEEWKTRVINSAKLFPLEEIQTLFRVIFRYASDLNLNNKENNLTEHELLSTGLILHYPRCELHELHSRIRSVLYWMQTRSHLKTLGPLINCVPLLNIANNSHEPLFRLNTAFKRMEYYWQKKEEKEKEYFEQQKKQEEELLLLAKVNPNSPSLLAITTLPPKGLVIPKVAESKGCSWSQFLIILNLFCTNQCELIPYLAFNIDHPKPNAPIDDLGSQYTFQSGDAMSTSSYSLSIGGDHYHHHGKPKPHHSKRRPFTPSMSLSGGNSISSPGRSGIFTPGLHMLDQLSSEWTSSLYTPSTSMLLVPASNSVVSLKDPSLLAAAKKNGKVTFNWDSSFAEYRFSHFKKKQKTYIEFPKELDLGFASTLNPRRPMTGMGGSRLHDDEEENNEEGKPANKGDVSRTASTDESIHSHSTLSDGHKHVNLSKSLPNLPSHGAAGKGKPPLARANTAALKEFMVASGLEDDSVDGKSHHPLHPSPLKRPPSVAGGLHQLMGASPNTPTLTRQKTLTPKESVQSLASLVSHHSHASHPTPLPTIPDRNSPTKKSFTAASPKPKETTSKPSTAKGVSFQSFSGTNDDDDSNLDDFSFSDENERKSQKKEIQNIDFFRICGLCELRLPRDAIEMKVFRKHIVQLRSTWDPKLVSKEVRSLDNTISMYNLVYVCYFCAQYFDPDFPDGIAYPTRIAPPTAKKSSRGKRGTTAPSSHSTTANVTPNMTSTSLNGFTTSVSSTTSFIEGLSLTEEKPSSASFDPLGDTADALDVHISNQKEQKLVPFYDTRHLASPKTVGEVLKRPETRESRKKAHRALEVVAYTERRRLAHTPVSEQN